MTSVVGIIGGLLFLVKIFLHIYLKSKAEKPISLLSLGRFSPPELFFHYFDDAPKGFKWLKMTINIMYAISILFFAIFLIGENIK